MLREKKTTGGDAYIGGDGEFLACAPREESGLGRRGSGCEEKIKEKRAGLLVWAEKVFPIFLFAKRFEQIRFEFKLHEFEFKSNHKQ